MNIERAVSTALSDLALGEAFTFDDLYAVVQQRRQRRLRIVELAESGDRDGLCAVWITTERDDIIIHARTESVLHRQQFVLHELAHMILGHCDGDECTEADALLPDIPPHTRTRLLRRQDLDSDPEIAAESLADRLAAGIRGSASADSRYFEVFG